MSTGKSWLRRYTFLWLALTLVVAAIVFINPVRQTAVDDDWSYALTVRNLLDTGTYKLHEWDDANMPFQAQWGRMFAAMFGYSFTSLRLSTLVLTIFGLIAFYDLARQNGLSDRGAGLLTFGLFSSPLVMRYSFTFNTDVPFLMCVVLAIGVYTRAIEGKSYWLMLLASCFAAAAVLTRQFGVALPAALVLLWVLSEECRARTLLFLSGWALPGIASFWQLYSMMVIPTWVQQNSLHKAFLTYFKDFQEVVGNVLWRPTVTLHYLALFSLPFVGLALFDMGFRILQAHHARQLAGRLLCERGEVVYQAWDVRNAFASAAHLATRRHLLLLAGISLYLVFGIVYGRFATENTGLLMPYLPWDETLAAIHWQKRAVLTLITAAGGVLYGYMIAQRYLNRSSWRDVPWSERLLDLFTGLYFVAHLLYFKFGDRYLLGLLPFMLIVAGRYLSSSLTRFTPLVSSACVATLVVCTLWTRGSLAEAEAKWKAAEFVRAAGVEPRLIFGFTEWNFYHGATEDYMSEVQDPLKRSTYDFWNRWYAERKGRAEFLISGAPVRDGEVVYTVSYSDALLRHREIHVVKRSNSES